MDAVSHDREHYFSSTSRAKRPGRPASEACYKSASVHPYGLPPTSRRLFHLGKPSSRRNVNKTMSYNVQKTVDPIPRKPILNPCHPIPSSKRTIRTTNHSPDNPIPPKHLYGRYSHRRDPFLFHKTHSTCLGKPTESTCVPRAVQQRH